MRLKSKTASLFALGIAALGCSRAIFFLINDPEGPNLLVVASLTILVYLILLAVYWRGFLDHK